MRSARRPWSGDDRSDGAGDRIMHLPRYRSHALDRGTLAVLGLALVLVTSLFTSGSGASASSSSPGHPALSPAAGVPSATTQNATLSVGGSLGTLAPEFWAVNYNFQSGGFANATVASLLNETPITWVRLPLQDTSYSNAATWSALSQFCDWTHCHSIATVGGPNVTATQAAADVARAESRGIHPDFWVFGNEPNLWTGETSLAYANEVYQWIQLVRQFNSSAQFIGVEISGNPRFGSDFIYNVTKIDGPYIQALAIQVYPQVGGSTLADFLDALTAPASVQNAILNARTLMAEACPTCAPIPLLLDEVNGGSGFNTNYMTYRETLPDATFLAASIVQGLRLGLVQFAPWTLTGASNQPANGTNHCDFGMIQLLPGCDQEYLQPSYLLYRNLLPKLGYGALTNLSAGGLPGFYGLRVTNGTGQSLLLVNANPTATEALSLGAGLPTSGTAVSYQMDPAHVISPAVSTVALGGPSPPTFVLPPTAVRLVRIAPATQVTIDATPSELILGQSAWLNVSEVGFDGPVTYSYPELPPGCASVNVSQLLCTPNRTGNFPVRVTVNAGGSALGDAETNLTVYMPPAMPQYPVTFLETGLPGGDSWSVSLNGSTMVSNQTAITTAVENGSYPFAVNSTGGLVPNPASGTLEVTGTPMLVLVSFASGLPGGTSPATAVTFGEDGLDGTSAWTVTIDNTSQTVVAANVTVEVAAGSHTFTVNATGYRATPSAGGFATNGTPIQQRIAFVPIGTSPPSAGGTLLAGSVSTTEFFGIVGLAACGVGGSLGTARWNRRRRYRAWFERERQVAALRRQSDLVRERLAVARTLASSRTHSIRVRGSPRPGVPFRSSIGNNA